jgi:hypothetical protein
MTGGTWEGVRDGLEGSNCKGHNSKQASVLVLNAEADAMCKLMRENPTFLDTLLKRASGEIPTVLYAGGKKCCAAFYLSPL